MKTVIAALNARYSHSSLALRYLKNYCDKFSIETAEFSINDSAHSIYAELLRKDADVYCFSCYIWNITQTAAVASMIKTAKPQCVIVFGGPQAQGDFDFVSHMVEGEGEQALFDLLETLEKGGIPPVTVKGEKPLELSTLPQPYTKGDIEKLKGKIIYFETSRGCPFACSYCLSSVQGGVRYFPMDYVKDGLKLLFGQRVPLVKLVDRTFNCNEKRAEEILKFIAQNSTCTCVHLEIAPHLLSDRLISVISSTPRLFRLEMGIQSTNAKALKVINRDFDLDIAFRNIKELKRAGVHIHLDLIAGLPYEDYDSFAKSYNAVYSLNPDMLQLGFLKVLHGTPIEKQGGIFFSENPPFEVLRTDWLTPHELCKLKDIEDATDRFYNSGAFKRSISILAQNNPFSVFERLAEMLKRAEENGSLPRYALYDILYDVGGNRIAEPLSLDFLQNNRSRPLPPFIKREEPDGFKEICGEHVKKHGLSLKNVRFEPLFGKIIMADYENDILKEIKSAPERT